MNHLARGPNLLGIDGKLSAAGRRIHAASVIYCSNEAAA